MTTNAQDQYSTTSRLQKNSNTMSDPNTTSGYPQDTTHTSGTTTGKTTSGPHKSNLMNKLDPRVDSKKTAEYNNVAAGDGAAGRTTTTGTAYGSGGTSGVPHTTTTSSDPYHSHQSPMERQSQPQGTFDNRSHNGGVPVTGTGGGTTATTGEPTMHGGGTGAYGTRAETAGPHTSNLANKADPRVDSDLSGGHPTTTRPGDRYYGGVGDGAGTGQAPMPSMINQGDPQVQGGGGYGQQQQPPPVGGMSGGVGGVGAPPMQGGTHPGGLGQHSGGYGGGYQEGHHPMTGGTHGSYPTQGNPEPYGTGAPTGGNPDPFGRGGAHSQPGAPTAGGNQTTTTTTTTTNPNPSLTQGVKSAAAGVHVSH